VADHLTEGYLERHPAAAARSLARLDERDVADLIASSPAHLSAGVLAHMTTGMAVRCLEQLQPKTAAEIAAYMPAQAAVPRLRLMSRDRLQLLLSNLPRLSAARLRLHLRYPETAIGALIDTDVLTLGQELRVGDALRQIRHSRARQNHSLYVLDDRRHLAGMVDISDLLAQADRVPVFRIQQKVPVVFNVRASIHAVDDHPAWLNHDALPVVNRSGAFQGVLQRAAVMREEQSLLTEVAEQRELATTRLALADLLWLAFASLFPGSRSDSPSKTSED
jgi:Mg/Co/Ni transporter MgtE